MDSGVLPEKGSEQVQLDELENLLNGQADSAQEFLVCEKQVYRQRGVQMDENRVFELPTNDLMCRFCLISLKKISICRRSL